MYSIECMDNTPRVHAMTQGQYPGRHTDTRTLAACHSCSCPLARVPPSAEIKIAGGLQGNGVIHPVAPRPSLPHPAPQARSSLPSSAATTHAPRAGICSPPSPPSTPRPASPHLVCLGQACILPPPMYHTTPLHHPHDHCTRQAGRGQGRQRFAVVTHDLQASR